MPHSTNLATTPPDLRARWSMFAPRIVDMIVAYEVELDEIHPGWRRRERFDVVDLPLKRRLKWLLKRHAMLGRWEDGRPAPLDWEVRIVADPRRSDGCFAFPVEPAVVPMLDGPDGPPKVTP